ncbi:MAG: radical SAM protein [Halobacteriovoraceae bacterium]|nr:radical SAM protein [Halobacteriovoraceae bacterium]|tara:strand:+ start:1595 stop:2518 length:924 start_codon:yes stop_codon:yes gene_type:complete
MDGQKFVEQKKTAKGEQRAFVELSEYKTLWFNTGTLCNLACENCYIESTPTNDRLVYLTAQDIQPYLDEVRDHQYPVSMIGLTGGEPFLNPNIREILTLILERGFDLLVLTNANRVLKRHQDSLLALKKRFGQNLHLRVSLDHFTAEVHDQERGAGAFKRTCDQLKWLYDHGFNISLASRSLKDEGPEQALAGHKKLLDDLDIHIDLQEKIVIFPEMQSGRDVPEITTACWDILNKSPEQQMCASERMIVKRKGEDQTVVMPCTLLAYDDQFILGNNLRASEKKVYLNHRFCAEFCVLGGASCSSTS